MSGRNGGGIKRGMNKNENKRQRGMTRGDGEENKRRRRETDNSPPKGGSPCGKSYDSQTGCDRSSVSGRER